MKKSKKLLSVLLAVLMLLSSLTVLASAAKAEYKTSENLTSLNAYSPYGAVTRLDTETRLSMVFDMLDQVLEDANINMGQLFNVAGLSLTIDLTSINALCGTLDNVKSLLSNLLVRIVKGLLGIIADVDMGSWQSGMKRENTDQFKILTELCEVLRDNADLVGTVLSTGKLNLGVASSAVKGLDISKIADIPAIVKGMIFPMFERKDDDQAQINSLANTKGNGGLQAVLNNFVNALFTKPQSTTTYKEDAQGNCISNHTLPTGAGTRYYYVKGTDDIGEYYEAYVYNTDKGNYEAEEGRFYKSEESDGVYTYHKTSGEGLKYYENDSYWLPSVTEAINGGQFSVDLTTNSAASLLYGFIPYVFGEMAPVVLNGSMKKLLGELFGATYTYVGDAGSDEVKALGSDSFFTEEQGEYVWEWTNYKVIDGTHYYRYEDKIFKGDTSSVNDFFALIDWNYKITDDFLNEFIPGADGNTQSQAGYTTLLQGLNDFLVKAANTVLADDVVAELALDKGDNSKLIGNIKKAAQTIVAKSPETIFGAEYADEDKYYNLIMSNNDQEVLIGIACTVLPMIMPQMILPTAETIKDKGYTIGAVLAAVLRELATQLVPNHNYDALIYDQYNKKTFVAGKDNEYWLDVILTMGTDIGVYYLKNLADMGEGTDAWKTGMPYQDSQTYTADDLGSDLKVWEARVDYIVDWALTGTDTLWAWHFGTLVDAGASVDLATQQDPWVKLSTIIKNLLPVDQILNVTFNDQWLKTVLKDNFVLAIADLKIEKISNMLIIPTDSVLRKANVFTQLTSVFKNLINGLLKKVATVDLIPAAITDIDTVLNQTNIITVVKTLLKNLINAANNGLLDPILPVANFFIGWTTDPQKMADPTLSFTNTDWKPYMYSSDSSTVNSTLYVRNDSSGMLNTHRQSEVVDNPYYMYITSVTSDYGDVTVNAALPMSIAPGAKGEIPISMAYTGDKSITVTVSYYYLFKDGNVVGDGTAIEETTYQYVSNKVDEQAYNTYAEQNTQVNNTAFTKVNAIKIKPGDTPKYLVVTGLDQVSYIGYSFANTNNEKYATWISAFSASGMPNFVKADSSGFLHGTNEVSDMKDATHGWMDGDNTSATIYPYVLNADVDISGIASGSSFNMGTFSVTWHNNKKGGNFGVQDTGGNNNLTWTINAGTIYYKNINELQDVFNQYKGIQRKNYAKNADAEWNAFKNAMFAAERTLEMPFVESTFAEEYAPAKLAELVKAIKDAYEALSKKEATATSASLEAALAKAEPGGDIPEINYQNYQLFEYFQYQDYRTAVRNRIKEYYGPVAPEKYFPDSSLSGKAVDEMLATVTNDKKATALKSSVIEPTAEELAAYEAAVEAFRLPTYSELDNANQGQLLNYYKQFLIAKTTEKQFLAKEIAYAAAQNYVAANYSTDSWAAYTEALENAKTVNAKGDALQSEVFDAKYALMVAENNLLAADKSAKDTGYTNNLKKLAEQAENIFSTYTTDTYDIVKGMTEEEAFAQLLAALGYYTDDGEILYAGSAYTFIEYDRELTQNNKDKIKAAEKALEAAIANFIPKLNDPEIFGREEHHDNEDVPFDGDQDHNGFVDDLNKYLYGIGVGQDILQVFHSSTSLNLIANEQGVTNGTGATVQLLRADGTVFITYTVVIFADVDGDAEISLRDANTVTLAAVGTSELEGVYAFAADVDGDEEISLRDANTVTLGAVGTATVTTNPYAE
ncbi:MAG: hypothetical protein J1F23_07605 [Oscillospiraceae bacterium]|nr:hypothetical protein [Oscillospiraceae bacterium]